MSAAPLKRQAQPSALVLDVERMRHYRPHMRARLQGLDEIAWDRTHPNNASGVDLPVLIRSVAAVLASTDEHFAELSRMRCRFEQPLMAMVARACALMDE